MSTLTPELRADGQQATIFCHRCGHDTTWTRVAERGTNVCNECGGTGFAMDHNDPTGTELFGKPNAPGACVCNHCVEDRERSN